MQAIVFLASLVTFICLMRATPGRVFLGLYLPVLMLIPDTFHTVTGGIPKVSFNQAVLVVLLPFVLKRYAARWWRLSVTDLLIFALAATMSTSEYQAAGYKEAQNLTFNTIATIVGPYLIGRILIPAEQLDVATARRFVILMFSLVLIGVWEFKFGFNPFLALLQPLFPGQGMWVTTFRYGFARVAGPFVHAILAGVMVAIAYRLQRWLEWGGHWEPRFKRVSLPWNKARVISNVLLAGAVMTFARGPWIGGALGGLLLMVGRSNKRKQMINIVAVVFLIVGPIVYTAFQSYLDIKPGETMTTSQESALYRKVLIDKYVAIAEDHALLGWGRNTWPKVDGMVSIDNYFLLLSLMHGILASGILLLLFIWPLIRLFRRGMAEPPGSNSMAFTFAGILIAVLVSLATVYLGENVMPAFFMVLGWAEGYLANNKPMTAASQSAGQSAAPAGADGDAASAGSSAPAPRYRVIR